MAVTDLPRRGFLRKLWILLGLAALAESLWLAVAFLRPRESETGAGDSGHTFVAGRVEEFERGSVTAFPGGRFYLACLEDGGFLALSRTCTHLGCTVPWVEEEGKFVCPCHASAFDIRGDVVSPPAPRALDIYPLRIEGDVIKVETGGSTPRKRFSPSQVVYPA